MTSADDPASESGLLATLTTIPGLCAIFGLVLLLGAAVFYFTASDVPYPDDEPRKKGTKSSKKKGSSASGDSHQIKQSSPAAHVSKADPPVIKESIPVPVSPPPEETPEARAPKKKKKKPKKHKDDDSEDGEAELEPDALPKSNAVVETPEEEAKVKAMLGESGGWAEVKKKAPVNTDKPELDEKAQARANKLKDLQKKRKEISERLKQLEDALARAVNPSGARRDVTEIKHLEARERLTSALARLDNTIQRLTNKGSPKGRGKATSAAKEEDDAAAYDEWTAEDDWANYGEEEWAGDGTDYVEGGGDWGGAYAAEVEWWGGGYGQGAYEDGWWAGGTGYGYGKGSGSSWYEYPEQASQRPRRGRGRGRGGKGQRGAGGAEDDWSTWVDGDDDDETEASPAAGASQKWKPKLKDAEEGEGKTQTDAVEDGEERSSGRGRGRGKAKRAEGKDEKGGKGGKKGGRGHSALEDEEEEDDQQSPQRNQISYDANQALKDSAAGLEWRAAAWESKRPEGTASPMASGGDSSPTPTKGRGRGGDRDRDRDRDRRSGRGRGGRDRGSAGIVNAEKAELSDEPETAEPDKAAAAEAKTSSILSRPKGERPNWGDAESSEEENAAPSRIRSAAAVSAAAAARRVAGIGGGEKKASADASAAVPSRANDAWDDDLVAFMGEDALQDDARFDEQLKYVPQWVADKALRRRQQLRHRGDLS